MDLPRFISKGPKKSTPTLVKDGSSGVTLSFGKSAMNCSPFAALNLLHVTHLEIILWIAETAPGIQNFCLRRASVWFLPLCPMFSWTCLIISWVTWWFFGKMTGCLASDGMADLLNRPPTLTSPFWRIGESLTRWLLVFTAFAFRRLAISSAKLVSWQNWMIAFSASCRSCTLRVCLFCWCCLYASRFFLFALANFSAALIRRIHATALLRRKSTWRISCQWWLGFLQQLQHLQQASSPPDLLMWGLALNLGF